MKYRKLVRDKIPEIIKQKGDILEVIEAICEVKQFSQNEVRKVKEKKANERGSFKKKIILDETLEGETMQ